MEQVLYQLPDGWKWHSLSMILEKTYNVNPLKDADKLWTYIDISSIDRKRFVISDPKEMLGKDAPSRAKKQVQKGDVLFATTRPNLKNIALVKQEYISPIASTGFCVLRASSEVLPAYLFYFITTDFVQNQIEPFVGGASYPAITDSNLKKAKIPIPGVEEQKRIVEKLDALLTRIDNAIELADALYKSSVDQVLNLVGKKPEGWLFEPLGKFVKLSQGIQVPVGDQFVEKGEGMVRFLRISDYVRDNEPIRYINFPGSKYIVEDNDVCMIRYGDAGKAVTGLAGVLANNLFKITPNERLLKSFLFLQLCSPKCSSYLRASNNSSTMPAISFKAVNALEIAVPPISEQKSIVEKLNLLQKIQLESSTLLSKKIDSLKQFKASILDSAFKGEL